jgi:hypothetical protein
MGTMMARGVPMGALASNLSKWVNRIVVDRTELTGDFDLDLKWNPDQLPSGPLPPGVVLPPSDPNLPSIFTALQEQLGLKFEAERGPVDVLVIDGAERPSEDTFEVPVPPPAPPQARQAASPPPLPPPPPPPPPRPISDLLLDQAQQAELAKLRVSAARVTLRFDNASFSDVVRSLASSAGIDIRLAPGFERRQPLSIHITATFADVFTFLVDAAKADIKTLDEKTVLLTPRAQ